MIENSILERNADLVDEANALVHAATVNMIEKARRANAPEFHPDFDGLSCVDCGDEIPKQRLALGKVRCVHCQTHKESRERMYPASRQAAWSG